MPFIKPEDRIKVNTEINLLRDTIIHISVTEEKGKPAFKRIAKYLAYSFYKLLVDIYGDEAVSWYEQGDVDKILDAVKKCFDEFVAIPYEKRKRMQYGKIIPFIADIDQKGVPKHA